MGVCYMVIEAGLVAGYMMAWLVRKAQRGANRLDATVDTAMDLSLAKLHELVVTKLGADPALEKLEQETSEGDQDTVLARTRDRVALSIEEAAEQDDEFASQVTALV